MFLNGNIWETIDIDKKNIGFDAAWKSKHVQDRAADKCFADAPLTRDCLLETLPIRLTLCHSNNSSNLSLSCRKQTCDSRLVYIAGLHRLTETAGPRLVNITYIALFGPTCCLTDLPGFVSHILCPALSLSWPDRKHT